MIAAMLLGLAPPSDWAGPGRFCGYSPIIDMIRGERIETLSGGIHGSSFRWTGRFGTLEVHGIGWASKPGGRMLSRRTAKGNYIFAEQIADNGYVVAIWNGEHGAAYFSSSEPMTRQDYAAIDRVALFNEGEEPQGCKYRTVFGGWE
jgi:hypothetical protein